MYTALAVAMPLWASAAPGDVAPDSGLQQCAALTQDNAARLACYDALAAARPTGSTATAASALAQPTATPTATPTAAVPPVAPVPAMASADERDCKNPRYSNLSRFWELESGSNCGNFGIRGYGPIGWSVVTSDGVNTQPSSPTPGHTAATATPYSTTETRIQVSLRTKVAQGLLTRGNPDKRDSLWFGYTQQSYWQIFTPDLSRPFRTTDHEPEITYIYPTDAQLPWGWRLRYTGLSLVHQSNGQSQPLSRSWNREILMMGMENGPMRLTGRLWNRVNEKGANDDNPDIENLIGRAELTGAWDVNPFNTLSMTMRHAWVNGDNGSVRLEWLKVLGDSGATNARGGLRLHTQLFTGYGDSLLDYNRRRTTFSVGLSLVDW